MRIGVYLICALAISACTERYCTDPDICWANRDDLVAAASKCGVRNFEPVELQSGDWAPWVPGEDPDKGAKTNCIVNEIESQGLMVTQ